MNYQINEELRQMLLQYLSNRPVQEVALMVADLWRLPPVQPQAPQAAAPPPP